MNNIKINNATDFLLSLEKKSRAEITEILFPNDSSYWKTSYMKSNVSTCALVAMAYLRELGFTDDELVKPYQKQIGMAVSNVVAVSKRHNGWISRGENLSVFPNVGDIILLGYGQSEHVLTVVGSNPNTGAVISIDGGQATQNTIKKRERIMISHNSNPFLVDPEEPYIKLSSTSQIPNGKEITGRCSSSSLLLVE